MLRIQNLSKSYGKQILFEEASLQMNLGERLGLIGRNGHGKSTLFRILIGEERPDSGSVIFPQNYRIGHLAQHLHFTKDTVLEEGCLGLTEEEQYDHYKVEEILFGLGFTKPDLDRPPASFSGGFQVRLNLAKILVSNPDLLLLDEPTNYLDILSIRWITKFLRSWKRELILISHDREFMDAVSTHTALIHRYKIRKLAGGTEKLYAQIAEEEAIYEKTRLGEEKQRKEIETFVNRFRAQATKAAAVQSRIKQLEKMPVKERLSEERDLSFAFHMAPFEAKTLLSAEELEFGFNAQNPLISKFSLTVQKNDRIAIIGKNGRGKSTLLNVLAGELAAQQGKIQTHPNTKLGYFGQTNINRLNPHFSIEQEIESSNPDLDRTAVRGICGAMLFSRDQAEKKIAVLSGGERSRVLLGKILAKPANLLFLDEPTHHLDMQSVDALIESIDEFPGAVVWVTHSESMLRKLAKRLVVFQNNQVMVFDGSYDAFLEKIGWEENNSDEPSKMSMSPSNKSTSTLKETRKQRSFAVAERSKILSPLKKEMTQLEDKITELEKQRSNLHEELSNASVSGQVTDFARLSKSLKEIEKTIETHFEKLASVTDQYETEEKRLS